MTNATSSPDLPALIAEIEALRTDNHTLRNQLHPLTLDVARLRGQLEQVTGERDRLRTERDRLSEYIQGLPDAPLASSGQQAATMPAVRAAEHEIAMLRRDADAACKRGSSLESQMVAAWLVVAMCEEIAWARAASQSAPELPLRPIPAAWMRDVVSHLGPNGVDEHETEFSDGDDKPTHGTGWVPLYRERGEGQDGATFDRQRFERAPCYLCGYNGEGYYQPNIHPCAAKYHAQQPPAPTPAHHCATCSCPDMEQAGFTSPSQENAQ